MAWALYDVANSSFTTLVVTFIYSTYFTGYMQPGRDLTPVWTTSVSVSALLIALLSPFVGAIADRGGYRKRFLLSLSALCVAATAALYFFPPGSWVPAIVVFVAANLAFELSAAMYDAFLPDLAPQEAIGRISGFGWGLGYVGGIVAMLVALYGFVQTDSALFPYLGGALGFTEAGGQNVRATNLLVAVWFAVFTLPFILFVKEPRVARARGQGSVIGAAYRQIVETFRHIRTYRQIVRLLVARLFYNDGLVVIFALGGVFAQSAYGLTTPEIIQFGVLLNVSAGIGALAFGFVDDRIGGRNTIIISIVGLIAATLVGVLGETRTMLWVSGVLIGLLIGPTQAASRSLLGRFVPDDKEAEFYGFFAFSGRATAFLGTGLYGLLTGLSGSHRVAMSGVILFFVAGLLLLFRVDEAEGIRLSGRPEGQDPEVAA